MFATTTSLSTIAIEVLNWEHQKSNTTLESDLRTLQKILRNNQAVRVCIMVHEGLNLTNLVHLLSETTSNNPSHERKGTKTANYGRSATYKLRLSFLDLTSRFRIQRVILPRAQAYLQTSRMSYGCASSILLPLSREL